MSQGAMVRSQRMPIVSEVVIGVKKVSSSCTDSENEIGEKQYEDPRRANAEPSLVRKWNRALLAQHHTVFCRSSMSLLLLKPAALLDAAAKGTNAHKLVPV